MSTGISPPIAEGTLASWRDPSRPSWVDPAHSAYWQWRSWMDRALAAVMLILTSPLMLLAMLVVRLTSPGPAIYRQRRVGQGGHVFTIYKIRSMTVDCERQSGAVWSVPGDPRVTAVGRFLRATHVDELPQLLNILFGEMSLIGPRPERPEILNQLAAVFPDFPARLRVKPGITGLAQVQLPPDTDISAVRAKLDLDLHYIENAGPALDCCILAATALKVVGVPFPAIRRLPGLS